VERDAVRAFELCRKAAESGYDAAQNNLALMYANGQGVSKDLVSAYMWIDLAADTMPTSAGVRDQIANEMTTAQIKRARELAAAKRAERRDK
jgi:TPR repeat protein